MRAACEVVGVASEVVGDAPLAAGAALAKVGIATSAGVRTGVVNPGAFIAVRRVGVSNGLEGAAELQG